MVGIERVEIRDTYDARMSPCRVATMLTRPGSGRPSETNVLRPMRIAWPMVVCLNHAKSSGMCQGIFPSRPDDAVQGHRGDGLQLHTAMGALMAGCGVVASQLEIFVAEVADIGDGPGSAS